MSARRKQGRPRPIETVQRDKAALDAVTAAGSVTRESLAEALRVPPSQAYLSLTRLREAGKVENVRNGRSDYTWRLAGGNRDDGGT